MEKDILQMLKSVCPDVKESEPMKYHTTFKIGGAADFFLTPDTKLQIEDTIKLCKEKNIPYFVLGNGSNLLVSDKGIEGVVINIAESFSYANISGTKVVAGAGILLSRLSKILLSSELTGFECASGIPGTLGGAIYMNAGAYGFEMKDVVTSVTYIDENGEIKTACSKELDFGYRKSMFSKRNCVILEIEMEFDTGKKSEILSKINEYTQKRNEKQPVNLPSAGSVFKRPEGYFAGSLIENAGLKGYKIGGAEVSSKHAGFIVNTQNATACDVLDLINHIIKTVEEKFGVRLEPEIKLIGKK